MTTALFLTLLVAAGIAGCFFCPRHDAHLRGRIPDPARWQHLYSAGELPVVMEALATIQAAFLLQESDICRLLPEDRLIDIYRAAYPHGGADAMEFEELFLMLSSSHHVPDAELERLQSPTVADIIQLCLCHAGDDA